MKQLKDMTLVELRELDRPRRERQEAQEKINRDNFLRVLAPKGYPKE